MLEGWVDQQIMLRFLFSKENCFVSCQESKVNSNEDINYDAGTGNSWKSCVEFM